MAPPSSFTSALAVPRPSAASSPGSRALSSATDSPRPPVPSEPVALRLPDGPSSRSRSTSSRTPSERSTIGPWLLHGSPKRRRLSGVTRMTTRAVCGWSSGIDHSPRAVRRPSTRSATAAAPSSRSSGWSARSSSSRRPARVAPASSRPATVARSFLPGNDSSPSSDWPRSLRSPRPSPRETPEALTRSISSRAVADAVPRSTVASTVPRPVPPRRSDDGAPSMASSATGPRVAWARPAPAHSQRPVASTGTAAARARSWVTSIRLSSTATEAATFSIATPLQRMPGDWRSPLQRATVPGAAAMRNDARMFCGAWPDGDQIGDVDSTVQRRSRAAARELRRDAGAPAHLTPAHRAGDLAEIRGQLDVQGERPARGDAAVERRGEAAPAGLCPAEVDAAVAHGAVGGGRSGAERGEGPRKYQLAQSEREGGTAAVLRRDLQPALEPAGAESRLDVVQPQLLVDPLTADRDVAGRDVADAQLGNACLAGDSRRARRGRRSRRRAGPCR